ncbi:Protein of unknown function [Pyronema omphalodes CBS 100304]|uniref:RING-type domain-containing protein n=1 Tax=Pyronema omphalodes (strain CBS 100304) TaxID=1076935 RepID=U4LAL9_PYROM|nr:Protein of unknown function [Pyronema omphalodes CBS 100304]
MIWTCCNCSQKSHCTTCECGHNFCLSCVYSRKPRTNRSLKSLRFRWTSLLSD